VSFSLTVPLIFHPAEQVDPLSKTRCAAYSFGSTSLFFKLGEMVTRPFFCVKHIFYPKRLPYFLIHRRKKIGISRANTVKTTANQPGRLTDSVSSKGAAVAVKGTRSKQKAK
jgi:hypothetical protein